MIGKNISHYRIEEKLGQGGMGIVYKATDTRLDRIVAIKVLSSHLTDDPAAKERFLREAKTAATLDHPNILTIHDADKTPDGELFIVMTYYQGRTLADEIRNEPISVERAISLAGKVAAGLASAHDRGILHRDIKPDNIFITSDNQVKILDFGLARIVDQTRMTQDGTALGTLSYMSPEQMTGAEVDQRADVFSLGVVLYELLTGQRPFTGEHEAAVIYSVTHSNPELVTTHRADIPVELARLVKKSLEKNPADRIQSAAEFADALKSFAGPQPVSAPPAGPTTKPRPRRNLWGLVSALALVLAVILGPRLLDRGDGESGDATEAREPRAIDEPTRVTLRQLTFDAGVEEYPAFSPAGDAIAYCADVEGFRQVFVKNLSTGSATQITDEARDHIQPAWAADEILYYVRAQPDGGRLEPGDVFGAHEGGDIWRHNTKTGEARDIVANAFNPTVSPTGDRLAFDADVRGARHIMVSDVEGRNARQVTSGSTEGIDYYRPRWSPSGNHIVFQKMAPTQFDIAIVDLATQNVSLITDDADRDINPVWHGGAIYFSSSRTGGLNVWRIPVTNNGVATAAPQQITAGAGQDIQLALSPDGSQIAMTILGINADLWRLPVSPVTGAVAGEPEQFVATTREDSRGSWRPDGTRIAFNSDRGGDMNIWVRDVNGSTARQVTTGHGGDYQPEWSPDGSKLVFFSSRAGNADVWTVDVNTADAPPEQLTTYPGIDINPAFSPNGQYIAWQSDSGGRNEVWVMSADGSNARQLSHTGTGGHFTLWDADSRHVIFNTHIDGVAQIARVSIEGGTAEPIRPINGGWHMSFSPSNELIMDVMGHKTIWVNPIGGDDPREVFSFSDGAIRIDYPRWSPDGTWVLFDGVQARGGDIWLAEGF